MLTYADVAQALNDSTFKSIQEAKMSGKKLQARCLLALLTSAKVQILTQRAVQDESVVSGLRKEVDKTQQDVLELQAYTPHTTCTHPEYALHTPSIAP